MKPEVVVEFDGGGVREFLEALMEQHRVVVRTKREVFSMARELSRAGIPHDAIATKKGER